MMILGGSDGPWAPWPGGRGRERERPPQVGVAPLSFIPAGRLGLGPDNRKRSQMKSPHIASVVGRRKPVDRAGNVRPEDAAIGGGA